MANLHKLQSELLNDDKITSDEVAKIQAQIQQDGQLDYEDIKFLIPLVAEAKEVCPEFDALFFPAMREVLLADGKIGLDEQFQLLRMLYADGKVRDCEKRFLRDLYNASDEVTPEFTELCETAWECPVTDWAVGGRDRTESV